jgi:hypothetical protein
VTDTGRLLTAKQCGELWGNVSERTVRRHIAAGELPHLDIAPPGSTRPKIRIREVDAIAYTAGLVRGRC